MAVHCTVQPVAVPQAHAIDFEVRVFDGEGRREITVERQRAVVSAEPLSVGAAYEIVTRVFLKPGRYNVRVGVHDNVAGKTGSVYGTVTVPNYDRDELSASGVFVEAQPALTTVIGEGLEPRLLPTIPTTRRLFKSTDAVSAISVFNIAPARHPKGPSESVSSMRRTAKCFCALSTQSLIFSPESYARSSYSASAQRLVIRALFIEL